MSIKKPRGKKGMREVWVYDPAVGEKVYVGARQQLRGPGGAKQLEQDKAREFRLRAAGRDVPGTDLTTVDAYAERWLKVKHGPGTTRPAENTQTLNEAKIRTFRADFAERELASIGRIEALDWSKKHPSAAIAVCAMFNDAIDDEVIDGNPFAKRGQARPRGRADINPLTEDEVDELATIAHERWLGYGRMCAAWILSLAYVGWRPGEAFKATARDVDWDAGEVSVKRVKPPYDTDVIVFPDRVKDAIVAAGGLPSSPDAPIFTTVNGKQLGKGNSRYYWDPVRTIFISRLAPERRRELLLGRPDFDMYELRHMCGSVMADRGASEHDIAHQLGNTAEVCRETYIHVYRNRTNDRVRGYLNQPQTVVDLDARRARRGDAS